LIVGSSGVDARIGQDRVSTLKANAFQMRITVKLRKLSKTRHHYLDPNKLSFCFSIRNMYHMSG